MKWNRKILKKKGIRFEIKWFIKNESTQMF
jgi:hypothetical protein